MTNLVRSALVSLGYKALAGGVRIPNFKMASAFYQWGRLMDLTHRLGINVILDVGANRGFFSKHLRMCGYRERLISFEPVPEDYERLSALAARDRNWTACCYALGAESGTKSFHVNLCDGNQTVLSSFLPTKVKSDSSHTVIVEIRRLDEVLPALIAEIASPRIFLKMDTQGFDNQVLEGASGYLDKIMGIQSEISVIPIYDGMPHYIESLGYYERNGFALMDLFVVGRQKDECIVEYDCLMVRPTALRA
jgi:FkbM family methyltransferase